MFEFLFKYPRTVFRKGEFVFASGWPGWLLLLVILAAAGGLVWHLRRNPGRLEGLQLPWMGGLQIAAVSVRRGSMTTVLPPRAWIASSRFFAFGADIRLPCDTRGLPPMHTK